MLRWAYGNQQWQALGSESSVGLYVLALLLEAKALATAAYEALELTPQRAAQLLYVSEQLGGRADFPEARKRCLGLVRGSFDALCESESMGRPAVSGPKRNGFTWSRVDLNGF